MFCFVLFYFLKFNFFKNFLLAFESKNKNEFIGAICCQPDLKDKKSLAILTLAVYAPFRRKRIGIVVFVFVLLDRNENIEIYFNSLFSFFLKKNHLLKIYFSFTIIGES